MQQSMESFLEGFNQRARPLYREMCESFWRASLSGRKEDEVAAAEAETRFRALYNSPEQLRLLRRWSDAHLPGQRGGAARTAEQPVDDSPQRGPSAGLDLRRQVEVLTHEFTSNQMPPEMLAEIVRRQKAIEGVFNTFRARVGERILTANQVSQILKVSRDTEERREVWEASKEIGKLLAAPLLELVALRNGVARDLGHPDFYTMSLELQELTLSELDRFCTRFEALSQEPFRKLRQEMDEELGVRFRLPVSELRPWHYGDPFFEEAPAAGGIDLDPLFASRDPEEIALSFHEGIGLPLGEVLARSDLREREGKDPHAYCIHVDRSGDVRILCNLRPTARCMGTLLHECGHAAYEKYLAADLPFTLRTAAHTLVTEGVANLMGRQEREPGWLRAMTGAPAETLEALGREGPLRKQMLVATRWMLVMIHFERELYADPDQDLNRLWWELVQRYQILRPPRGRDHPDWATKLHLACFPVYYHNYLLGEFVASQLRAALDGFAQRGGDETLAGRGEVGRFLRERIFAPGARYRWDELLRRATGESLNPEHFVRQFVRDSGEWNG
jgi:peptidyl-dipeptidase A